MEETARGEEDAVIRIKDGNIISTDKKNTIAYTIYEPRSPRAVVHIVHGMSEYFGRYEKFARYLADNGVVVIGSDLIGHGRTAPNESEYGHFEDYNVLVEDQKLLIEVIRRKYRTLPYVIFGHSMGSFIVRSFIMRHGGDVDGAVICGTAGRNKSLGFGLFVTNLLTKLRGAKHISKFVNKTVFGAYAKAIPGATGFEWLTKDGDIVKEYVDDKMCGFPFTVKAFNEEFKMLREVTEEGWTESVPLALPILVCAGTEDPVGDNGKGPSECYGDLEDHECCDLSIKLYPGDRHEILNETDRREVWADILEWVNGVRDGKNEAAMYGAWPPVGGSVV